MKTKSNLSQCFFTVLFLLLPFVAKPQGCADAGFCTTDNIRPHAKIDTVNNYRGQLKIGHSYGLAQFGVHVFSPYIEYRIAITDKLSFTNKILAAFRSGELTRVFGLSDIISTINYRVASKISVIAGAKIPLNKGDLMHNGVSLPMSYQTSLGTYDLILGGVYQFEKLSITLAYQQPLSQNNNSFFNDPTASLQYAKPYYTTNKYQRKADVLLRLSYPILLKNGKTLVTPSIMPIYHLANDSYTDSKNQIVAIQQSQGLTLNVGAFLYHTINKHSAIELSLGLPALARKARPDGLSQFAFTVEYLIQLQRKKS